MISCIKIEVCTSRKYCLKHLHILEVWCKKARKIFLAVKLVLMLVEVFAPLGFNDCVAAEGARRGEYCFDSRHEGSNFCLGEVFNCCILHDVVEWAIWDVGANVSNAKRQVWGFIVALCPTDCFAIEVNSGNLLGSQGIEVVRVEAISATQVKYAAVGSHCKT